MPPSRTVVASRPAGAAKLKNAQARRGDANRPRPAELSSEARDIIADFGKAEARLELANNPDSRLCSFEVWSEKILSKEHYPLRSLAQIAVQSNGDWEPADAYTDEEQQQLIEAGGSVLSLCEYLEQTDPCSKAALAAKIGMHAAIARAELARGEIHGAMTQQHLADTAYLVFAIAFKLDRDVMFGRANAKNFATGRDKAIRQKKLKADANSQEYQRYADPIWEKNPTLSKSDVAKRIKQRHKISAHRDTIRKRIKEPN